MSRSMIRIKGTLLLNDHKNSIARAARIIRRGGLVAFPTETVYGLGASATDTEAVKKIFTAKGRPPDNPLIVHLSDQKQLRSVAREIPDTAYLLIEKYWPGPLSLVLQRSKNIPEVVSAGLPTVAVRMPDHRVALNLIRLSRVPIAAPSANWSGRPSPTDFRHVLEDLSGRIDAVIKSNVCAIGVESTVLDLTGSEPVILRPGGLSRERLEETLGCHIRLAGSGANIEQPSSPGMRYRHYSPLAPLILVTGAINRRRRLLNTLACHYNRKGFVVGMLNFTIQPNFSPEIETGLLAAKLFLALRQLDARKVDLILAEETETTGLGLAVMNRLRKAAARTFKV